MMPLVFVRELYCLKPNYHRYTGYAAYIRGCPTTRSGYASFRSKHPALFDASAWSDHPYDLPKELPPDQAAYNNPSWAEFAQIPHFASVLDYIQRHDLVRAASARGAQLVSGLRGLIDRHRVLGDVRGLGLMLGVELVQDRLTREPVPVESGMAFRFARACIEAGAAVYPGQSGADGQVGDHALITPPLTITEDQVDELVGAIDRALTQVEAEAA